MAVEALAIWQAAVDAVRGDAAVQAAVEWDGQQLTVMGDPYPLAADGRILVVGAGKAAPAMGKGLVEALPFIDGLEDSTNAGGRLLGWLNVPGESIDQLPTGRIHLHPARPHGINLPTAAAVEGTHEIRRLLRAAGPKDLVVVLLSGGGSSLLVEPVAGLELRNKISITQALSESGATIHELNAVRRCLSTVKGGGLLNRCRADHAVALIISDVLDNDLSVIASGPTVASEDAEVAARNADAVVERLLSHRPELAVEARSAVGRWLQSRREGSGDGPGSHCANYILANNATAVDAAGTEAVRRGWNYLMMSHRSSEGDAAEVGRAMARLLLDVDSGSRTEAVDCWIFGGEPTVDLRGAAGGRLGSGGRNQHLVAAAADELIRAGADALRGYDFCLVSAGTDGEDGTTSVAGAWLDREGLRELARRPEAVADALAAFDSHTLFRGLGATVDSGPTGTNVCDVRILLRRPVPPS